MSLRIHRSVVALCVLAVAALLFAAPLHAAVPLGGFIPFVGIGMTDESKTIDDLDLGSIPFIADAQDSLGAPLLGAGGSPHFELALLDTGAATHIITQAAFNGFDLLGNNLDGLNEQPITGSTGSEIITIINDAAGIYAAGLGPTSRNAGTTLSMKQEALRGQTSIATLTAPEEWTLPNILGLPMAAQHAIAIRNSQPQIFQFDLDGDGPETELRTVRTPQVEFLPLGTGGQQQIIRRAGFKLRPSIGFVTGPQFVFNLDIDDIFAPGGIDVGNDPASPSVVQDGSGNGGGLFLEVDMANGSRSFQDKEFLFDTGADFTVVSQITAARLGFDAILDTPDFLLEVEGAGGVSAGIPGFYIDELNIDTVGGTFTLHHVPIAVLDVPNPNDPGNAIDGIIGMHLFTGRDLIIDANPASAGAAPSLYIGNPVATTHTWAAAAASANWATGGSWSAAGTPGIMWDADVRNAGGVAKTANVTANSTVYRMTVASPGAGMTVAIQTGATLTTYGETLIEAGGRIRLQGGKLDAQFVNVVDGGVLSGAGEIFVGTGPVNGAVRNLSGRIEPGNTVGVLSITGDLANIGAGVLAFDLGGTTAGTQYDQIEVSRYAFLGGTLEVSLANLGGGTFAPAVNNSFTLISGAEDIFGEFDNLSLPPQYQWQVQYLDTSVVLKVTGIGSLPGDFNNSGGVDGADLATWKTGFPLGTYNGADFLVWQRHVAPGGAVPVPEPGAWTLALFAAAGIGARRRRSAG
jgi:hypothetical protein